MTLNKSILLVLAVSGLSACGGGGSSSTADELAQITEDGQQALAGEDTVVNTSGAFFKASMTDNLDSMPNLSSVGIKIGLMEIIASGVDMSVSFFDPATGNCFENRGTVRFSNTNHNDAAKQYSGALLWSECWTGVTYSGSLSYSLQNTDRPEPADTLFTSDNVSVTVFGYAVTGSSESLGNGNRERFDYTNGNSSGSVDRTITMSLGGSQCQLSEQFVIVDTANAWGGGTMTYEYDYKNIGTLEGSNRLSCDFEEALVSTEDETDFYVETGNALTSTATYTHSDGSKLIIEDRDGVATYSIDEDGDGTIDASTTYNLDTDRL